MTDGSCDGPADLPYLSLPANIIARMTAGAADAETLGFLTAVVRAKHRLLLTAVGRHARAGDQVRAAFDILDEARRRDPAASDALVAFPWVGAWAATCAVRLRDGAIDLAESEVSYVNGLAAVAALRTGIDVELPVWASARGRIPLSTLGAAHFDAAGGAQATVQVAAGRVRFMQAGRSIELPDDLQTEQPWWQPVRRLTAEVDGHQADIALDDLDPYRASYRMPVAQRMSTAEFDEWKVRFAEAWELLVRHVPDRAAELAPSLRCLVPLSAENTAPGLSATSRIACGALALTLPPRATHLAATLVHEFQHSKLSTLLDALPLHDPASTQLYFAPWRRDPRPLGGLLQGAYAFLAVTEVWNWLRAIDTYAEACERYFAELRLQVDDALTTLEGASCLNPQGRAFVAGLRRSLMPLLWAPVSKGASDAAQAALASVRSGWLERNALVIATMEPIGQPAPR